LVFDFATRIAIRIPNLLRNERGGHVVQPTKSCRAHIATHVDFSMADAWIKQQDRVREAIATANRGSPPPKDAELDDEWVGPWMRQQQRVRDAIAQASARHVPAGDPELDDEWIAPWIRQQERVRDAIAQAKRHSRGNL